LKFTPNGKILYFSTVLSNNVQSYNVAEQRLLEPVSEKHSSPPTLIEVSPTSHILITVSQKPCAVFMKYRQGPWEPFLPSVSKSDVSVVAFHPQKPHIFLLGFKDGSLGLYNANRSSVKDGSKSPAKELSNFRRLHNSVRNNDGEACGITGAAFLRGPKMTAVTVGMDGKCKVVDFDTKSIRNWSVKAPATCLAVLFQDNKELGQKQTKAAMSVTKSAQSPPVIAVGRIDGQLRLYNSDGDLLQEETVGEMNGAVLDLEWISGESPEVLGDWTQVNFEKHPLIDLSIGPMNPRKASTNGVHSTSLVRQPDATEVNEKSDQENMAVDAATVRHTDIRGVAPQFPTYMDLFSPIKRDLPSPNRTTSPRSRPRITSSTFVEQSPQINPSKSLQSTPKASEKQEIPHPTQPIPQIPTNKPEFQAPKVKKRVSPKKVSFKPVSNSGSMLNIPAGLLASQNDMLNIDRSSSTRSSANSEILSRIRALRDENQGGRKARGSRAALAPYYGNSTINAAWEVTPRTRSTAQTSRSRRESLKSNLNRARVSIGTTGSRRRSSRVGLRPRIQRKSQEAEIWFTDSDQESPRSTPKSKLPAVGNVYESSRNEINQSETTNGETIYRDISNNFADIPSSLYDRSTSFSATSSNATRHDPSSSSNSSFHIPLPDDEARSLAPNDENSKSTTSSRKISHSTSPELKVFAIPQANQPLPPGFAQSYHGPVKVEHYLPRRQSLIHSTLERGRSDTQTDRGNHVRTDPNEGGHAAEDYDECARCYTLRTRVDRLEQELAELKSYLMGHGNTT
jgi:hypothetical protein